MVEVDADSELSAASKASFLDKVRQSNQACQSGDFETAVGLYGEAIALDPCNHILFSNRSAALVKLGHFARALQDASRAVELNAKWPKGYYRQGVALQCLGRHSDALAAFSSGLAQDPKSLQLLAGLVEAAMKSPLRSTLEPTYRQLQAMRLDKSPFVVISVIGQELLAAGHYKAAVVVLEAALRIGTCSLKLRGSVFSALSSAYWALSMLDQAISYMQQDLSVAKSLGDTVGECRAHGNLGSAYFSKGNFKEALTSHRYQLVLAMKCKDNQAAALALTSLGHVYTAIGDYPNALASHKQCLQLVKQLGERLPEAREVGNVGAVYLAMGDFDAAVECHMEHLRIAKQLGNRVEEARAYSNLGSSHHFRRNFERAITFHNHVLHIAQELNDRNIEARAYAGLGHAARCMSDYGQAKRWHERQLDMALATRDKVAEGRACSNLGIVYQLLGDHDAALKLHQAHLNIARVLQDRAGMGRAYGNIGNAYSAMGYYEQAIKYHKQELTISKEVNDRSSEASTHGNLAVAYQALHMHDMAILHYHSHLNIARELKDTAGEACALLNLGNCHSSRAEFGAAVTFYEQYLMLSQELQDVEGEAKACHFLGYAHYCLGNFKEAIRYYDQDLALAKDLQDKMNMGRAYCNLGLSHLALGNMETALECQRYFLTITHITKHAVGKFRALGNIGDLMLKMNQSEESVNIYQKQLQLAKQMREKGMEASSYAALAIAHRHMGYQDKALGCYTQELTLRQETGDVRGECRAHGHLASVHMALGNYTHAIKCYEEQLDRAKELRDSTMEAQAHGNLGIARLNMGHYEEAIGYFEQQLATLAQLSTATAMLDKGRAFGNLGDCYDALGDYDEAIKCHEQCLAIALKTKSLRDQEHAYRGLGQSHRCLGNLQQALVCFEKRLVVAHELGNTAAKAQAYGELGQLHSVLGNFEQAVSCLEHQISIARKLSDRQVEAEAASGLGCVYQQMGEHTKALQYHQLDLRLAEETGSSGGQCRAYGNLGATQESLGRLDEAVHCQEQHLSMAAQINDKVAKTKAFASLGRLHHGLGNPSQAVAYLQQGLQISEALSLREEEARIRHRLGLALWGSGDLDGTQMHMERAAGLLEAVRREARGSADYRLSLFDLQTACYQILQRVLVDLGRSSEALLVAERGRTRAFVDLLLERQGAATSDAETRGSHGRVALFDNSLPTSVEQIMEIVNKQKASVLYYSLAAGYLYCWLIVPTKGVVAFHQAAINPEGTVNVGRADSSDSGSAGVSDNENEMPKVEGSLLDEYIQGIREALGVEWQSTGNNGREDNGDLEDLWSQHLGELGDKLNQEGDRSGFLRMVNRSHAFNSSNYSLSSLFSLGSVSINSGQSASQLSSVSRPGSLRHSRRSLWQGPACLRSLYDLLLAPVEDRLTQYGQSPLSASSTSRELVLVLDGDLYLVPFSLLKPQSSNDYLCERFSLIVSPSLTSLRTGQKSASRSNKLLQMHQARSTGPLTAVSLSTYSSVMGGNDSLEQQPATSALVIGNPKMSQSVVEQWGWTDIPYAEQEAVVVAEMLQTPSLLAGAAATKDAVLRHLSQVECIHFATHVSWKMSAIVLAPSMDGLATSDGDGASTTGSTRPSLHQQEDDMKSVASGVAPSSSAATADLPALSEFLLTAADILNLRLCARLVVVSSVHTRDHHGVAHSDGVVGLTRALLAAGAQSVLVSLWPVPDTAVKIFMRTFYSSLLQGARASRALSEAQQTVQHTKHFAHPANWAGFVLVGADVRLSNKVALMGQALTELLKTPDKCRDALRVTLHLVEKSLQRIHRGYRNAMYTTQRSIENKVGPVTGWKELLISVGFRFEPTANNIPASVFFPQSDPGERLTQCSASLQALLGLTTPSLLAISKLLASSEASTDDITAVLRNATVQLGLRDLESESVDIPVPVKLWRLPGCHELLASLGFDLMEVGRNEVTLRTGKLANKRNIQFALQALLALFETLDSPTSLSLESSSSVESLTSDEEEEEQEQDGTAGNQRNVISNRSGRSAPSVVSAGGGSGNANGTGRVGAGSHQTYSSLVSRRMPLSASVKSAFSSYVRSGCRGEPDGRTAVGGDSRGRESDAAFTPSPVDPVHRTSMGHRGGQGGIAGLLAGMSSSAGSDRGVPVPSLRMSLTLAHQSKIRSMYCSRQSLASQENSSPASEMGTPMMQNSGSNNPSRPDSSSSTTSSADWESGLSTVRRQPPISTSHGKAPSSNARKVEDISAFNESRLRLDAKSFGLHNNTLTDARSRSRFKPPGGFAAGLKRQMALHQSSADDSENTNASKTGSARSGSLDTLDRLSVRSEVAKAPSAFPATGPAMQQRRRHRSVERQLDDDTDSVVCEASETPERDVVSQVNERFSAAVFHHSKPGKLVMAKAAAAATRTLHKNGATRPSIMSQRPVDNCTSDHEMDASSVIYSLRPGESELSSGVQLSHNAGSRSIQDHIIATQMNRLNREMPISDVYHERNMGLGLAPPLSELLVNTSGPNGNSVVAAAAGSGSVASSEDVFNSFDQISLADTVTELSDKADTATKNLGYAKRPPPRPTKLQPFGSSWGTSSGAFHATGPRLQHRISVFDTVHPQRTFHFFANMTLRPVF
uniref:CHAT domain-containing protein n=1 Tax=Daphnia galeata TaxID=27404 RepID=A0A8J2RJ73_9CRUS|nr:unnamed protein product [Daphnia galeata]